MSTEPGTHRTPIRLRLRGPEALTLGTKSKTDEIPFGKSLYVEVSESTSDSNIVPAAICRADLLLQFPGVP